MNMHLVWFWVAAGAITAMVALVLIQALRRGRDEAVAAPGAEDVGVYRDQLAEVDRDRERGVIGAAETERLKVEISRRLLAADARQAKGAASGRPHMILGLGLVALALAGAAGLYVSLGHPRDPDQPIAQRMAMAEQAYRNRPSQARDEAMAPKPPAPKVDAKTKALMDELKQALKTHPDDVKGLGYLVDYEAQIGNFQAAEKAMRHILEVKGDKATANDHGQLAEIMILAAGGQVSPEAEQELRTALKLDPKSGAAQFYLGLMYAQVGRPDRTFELWQPLLAKGPATAPWIPPIRQQIEAVAQAAGIRYNLPPAADAKGPTAEQMAAAQDMTPEQRQKMIQGMVDGLEKRLLKDGGPVEDWTKLIGALGVLKQTDRAQVDYEKAKAAFAGDPGSLSALQAAAVKAGLTP